MKIVTSKPEFIVDENSNLYRTDTLKLLNPWVDKDGYLRCSFTKNGKTYHLSPHRAVAEMYIINPKPEEYKVVNHKDCNKQNNKISNLEWVSVRINVNHAHLTKRFSKLKGEYHSQVKINEKIAEEICKMLSEGRSTAEISRELQQPRHRIQNIKRGLCWRSIAESHGLNIPPAKKHEGIEWLIEEKQSLGINVKDLYEDYNIDE